MAVEELRILATVERMETWLHKTLEKIPKYARFPVYAQMKGTMRIMRKLIIECNQARDKTPYFDQIDLELLLLRSDVRVMLESRLITPGEFKVWGEEIDKIGRQLGAWTKACHVFKQSAKESAAKG